MNVTNILTFQKIVFVSHVTSSEETHLLEFLRYVCRSAILLISIQFLLISGLEIISSAILLA